MTYYEEFCWFIQEREKIRRNKESGLAIPWTNDPILQKYRFTNVWRQDDAVTKAVMQRIEHLEHKPQLAVANIIWLRSLNRVESINIAPLCSPKLELTEEIKGKLKFGDAYVTVPSWKLKKGETRFEAIKKFIDELNEEFEATLETDWDYFLRPRSWFVGLPRYEIMLDFWQFYILEEAYCNVGLGAAESLKKILGITYPPSEVDINVLLARVKKDLPITHEKWGELTPRCIEGMCCEYRKYLNLKSNPKKFRKRYYEPRISDKDNRGQGTII